MRERKVSRKSATIKRVVAINAHDDKEFRSTGEWRSLISVFCNRHSLPCRKFGRIVGEVAVSAWKVSALARCVTKYITAQKYVLPRVLAAHFYRNLTTSKVRTHERTRARKKDAREERDKKKSRKRRTKPSAAKERLIIQRRVFHLLTRRLLCVTQLDFFLPLTNILIEPRKNYQAFTNGE